MDVKERRVVIDLPESFVNHRIELTAVTLDEEAVHPIKPRRQPHPEIAGQGKTLGDIVTPIVDANDWECLK
ncbi:MAG: hypothetical protein HQL64_00230 [Magnetococcales bacterium]|nr:hypothetical protein [Magnetococcales bacterium]